MTELFSQLREFKWRDVSFPSSSFEVTVQQDHAQHRYPGQDGANIEATGRAPLYFTAKIPFRNGIAPGKGESWGDISTETLYPFVYRKFLLACADRSTGSLQHPELGESRCKVESVRTLWDANRRDGVDVDVSWIESTEDLLDATNIHAASPIATAEQAGADLDGQLASSLTVPVRPEFKPDFGDIMRGLKGISDQLSILEQRTVGKIDQVLYRVDALSDSVAKNKSSLDWPLIQSIERIRDSLLRLKEASIQAGGRFPSPGLSTHLIRPGTLEF